MAASAPAPAAGGGFSPALLFGGASAGLDLLSGLFGFFTSRESAKIAESRGRMLRLEADADAQRYAESARTFKETQALAFLKSGVELTGSPLDILDETARVAAENISAIRAQGRARQSEQEELARETRERGRGALISGITGGFGKLAWASYTREQNKLLGKMNRKDIAGG